MINSNNKKTSITFKKLKFKILNKINNWLFRKIIIKIKVNRFNKNLKQQKIMKKYKMEF